MIGLPERSAERDAALAAALAHVPFEGWTMRALRAGLRDIGAEPMDAELLFPGGVPDLIETFADWADREMEATAALEGVRLSQRVRALVVRRLAVLAPHKEAERRAVAALALPGRARVAPRCAARTVDAIWHAAGDQSSDFSWYTKRAILAGVWGSTLLFWLADHGEDAGDGVGAATLAFLDRRLADVAGIGRLRKRCEGVLARFRPGAAAA